jgi:hypothetical protein
MLAASGYGGSQGAQPSRYLTRLHLSSPLTDTEKAELSKAHQIATIWAAFIRDFRLRLEFCFGVRSMGIPPQDERSMSEGLIDPRRDSPEAGLPDQPATGSIVIEVGDDRVVLTDALYWVEDGEHTIASSEFQVAATADSFRAAYAQMLDNLAAEARSLGVLIREGDAAPNEIEEGLELLDRFAELSELQQKAERKRELEKRALRRRTIQRGNRWGLAPRNRRALSGTPSRA